jgi:hypothetical protein
LCYLLLFILCPGEEFSHDFHLACVDDGADVHAEGEGAGVVEFRGQLPPPVVCRLEIALQDLRDVGEIVLALGTIEKRPHLEDHDGGRGGDRNGVLFVDVDPSVMFEGKAESDEVHPEPALGPGQCASLQEGVARRDYIHVDSRGRAPGMLALAAALPARQAAEAGGVVLERH